MKNKKNGAGYLVTEIFPVKERICLVHYDDASRFLAEQTATMRMLFPVTTTPPSAAAAAFAITASI
jgi:hypothetical protein